MHRLFEHPRHLGHTHGRTKAVKILIVMTHDIDFIGPLHDFPDCMGNNTRLDARMLLDSLGTAAKELRLTIDEHSYLIAATAQSQVKACLCL